MSGAGFRTGAPEATKRTPRMPVARFRSLNRRTSGAPRSTSLKPGSNGRSKYRCNRGRRRSADTATTECPTSASVAARCATVVVFPSPPVADVTTTTRGPAPLARPPASADRTMLVRSPRYASMNGDGCDVVIM